MFVHLLEEDRSIDPPTLPIPRISPGYSSFRIPRAAKRRHAQRGGIWYLSVIMIRTLVFHHLSDMNDLPAAERWFYRYHVPEVMRNRPLSYVSFRAVPPPPGAEAFGYFNYKVHENISSGEQETPLGLTVMTREVVPLKVAMVDLPAYPTEDFKGFTTSIEEKTVLRWLIAFKYPEGVSVEQGDDWFLNVHAEEVARQPGLTRFFSYRVLASRRFGEGGRPSFLHPESTMIGGWHRVSEQWYEDASGWARSVVESPPSYTAPPWATYHQYPFLEPGVDFISTFILERPSDDWLRQVTPFYV